LAKSKRDTLEQNTIVSIRYYELLRMLEKVCELLSIFAFPLFTGTLMSSCIGVAGVLR